MLDMIVGPCSDCLNMIASNVGKFSQNMSDIFPHMDSEQYERIASFMNT